MRLVYCTVAPLAVAAGFLSAPLLFAQERPDSLLQLDESVSLVEPIGFDPADVSGAEVDSLLFFDHDLSITLGRRAGSFTYDFGAFGWPAGWSYLGMSPNHAALYWQGIPFDDPLTGRPRFDLLPTALTAAPAVVTGVRASPAAVLARLRSFDASRPLTELHYQAGDHGLQRVTVLHTQQSQRQLFGRTGLVTGLFGYAGAAAKGEYPGSRLKRMRQLLLRTQYERPAWSLEVMYLHNARRLGAHGGVLPSGDYLSVYNRLTAITRNENAVRRDIRHDASATLRIRALDAPLTLQLWYTYARLRYTRAKNNATEAAASRWGLRMRQPVRWNNHRLRLMAEGFVQRSGNHTALRARFAVRDSVGLGTLALVNQTGVTWAEGKLLASGSAEASLRRRLYAAAFAVGVVQGRFAVRGFGQYAATTRDVPAGSVAQARLGTRIHWRVLDVDAFVFLGLERDLVDYLGKRSDSLVVQVQQGTRRVAGAAVDAGLRRHRHRGFYAHAQALLLTRSSGAAGRNGGIVPRLSLQGRLGVRYRLFTGDLLVDLSLRSRLWASMTSRTLHAPTGLLVIPDNAALFPAAGQLPASGTVSAFAEAWVRTAVLFVAYENAASGTPLMEGNQIVPVYPLPASRLRFGVFWPIAN